MIDKKIVKGTFSGAFLLIFILLLVACTKVDEPKETKKAEQGIELTEIKSEDSPVKSDILFVSETQEISSSNFNIKFIKSEEKQDIDSKDSWFIYADITNLSEESIYPEAVWNTYLRFSDSEDGFENLYQNVLPKKDLDGSDYKTAVDNMSKELQTKETLRIGSFYNLPEDKKIYLSIMNDDMEVFYQGEIKLK